MKKIPITVPYFDKKEEDAAVAVIRSGWHTQGPKVLEFEKKFAEYVDTAYAVAVSNCTTALHLALLIAGVGKEDEVIVPSFTFIASANMIPLLGAAPVFIDVDWDTYNLDVRLLESKITKKTKAIITVDQIGLASDIDKINAIARKHNLFVIADAACAVGAKYKGKMVGGLADITCFSFHPRKVISTGEGGMLTTNSKRYAEKARLWRNHGMSLSDMERHEKKTFTYEKYLVPGFNYRMTDIQAAIGIEQMKKLPMLLAKRKAIARRYTKAFSDHPYLEVPIEPQYAPHTWQAYLLKIKKQAPFTARRVMQKLMDDGIAVKRGIMACHLEPVYRKQNSTTKLPVTEKLIHTSFCLPIYPKLSRTDQEYIIRRVIYHTMK